MKWNENLIKKLFPSIFHTSNFAARFKVPPTCQTETLMDFLLIWFEPNFNQFNFFIQTLLWRMTFNLKWKLIVNDVLPTSTNTCMYMTSCIPKILYQCFLFSSLLFSKGTVAMWPNYARERNKEALRSLFLNLLATSQTIFSSFVLPRLYSGWKALHSWHSCIF